MAGIGFALRRLFGRDDLFGVAEGCIRSALPTTGPWLLTVLCLAGIEAFRAHAVSRAELTAFQIVVYYNFAFSLVLSGPWLAVATRHLSDLVYTRRIGEAMGLLFGSLTLLLVFQAVVVVPFYFAWAKLDLAMRLLACVNFLVVSALWLAHVFLATLHNDRKVAISFVAGLAIGLAAAVGFGRDHGAPGMLAGFTAGLAIVLFALFGRIFAEYPRAIVRPWAFLAYFRTHGRLAVGGLVYNAAIWEDKWLMWGAPEGTRQPCGLVSFLHYDSAMFLAYLTIVPAIALFVMAVETRFYEAYLKYLRDIREHAPWAVIEADSRSILASILAGARPLLVWQGLVTVLAIVLAPVMLEKLGIAFVQLGMFRLGALGAFFQALLMFVLILLSYFELHRETLALQIFFLASNAALTLGSRALGFAWYGSGYALSAMLSFGLACLVAFRLLPGIPYETFVRRNPALRA